VIHLEDAEGGAGTLVLFVVLAPGVELDDRVRREITTALRTRLSPRHVPDLVHQVSALPHTLSGKRLEVPVKKILRGVPTDEAVARGALTAPEALTEFEQFRDRLE
jgi:acetoacetyl-CoA synthetase